MASWSFEILMKIVRRAKYEINVFWNGGGRGLSRGLL